MAGSIREHILSARRRIFGSLVFGSLGWTLSAGAGVVLGGVLVSKIFAVLPPGWPWWVGGVAGAAVVTSVVWAVRKRPTELAAAVMVDESLGLKEKFSTAVLLGRAGKDEFVQAALRDAESVAGRVSVAGLYRPQWRWTHTTAVGLSLAGFVSAVLLPQWDVLARQEQQVRQTRQAQAIVEAKKTGEKALVAVQKASQIAEAAEALKPARRELEQLMSAPISDPAKVHRTALRAMEEVKKATAAQAAAKNRSFARSEQVKKALADLQPSKDDTSDLAEAQRKLAQGDTAAAMQRINKAVASFGEMSAEEQKKAAEQMAKMAEQMRQMATDPQQQQKMQQQLQNMGMDQKQAQQLAQQIRQAAQGDAQAQQQLNQTMQQLMQQLPAGQQSALQQTIAQMQAQAQNSANQQALAQSAQQLAQAMAQQANQQPGQQGQQSAQQGGQQQQSGQQSSAQQQGQQQGQQGNQQGQQASAQQQGASQGSEQGSAGDAMQQALEQMQAQASQAQAASDAQAAADAAAAAAAMGLGGQGQGEGDGQGQGGGNSGQQPGQWNDGQDRQPGAGMAGGGVGSGDRNFKEAAPFGTKIEKAPQQLDEKGKLLAVTLIKAGALTGEAKQELREVTEAAAREAAEEVKSERVGRAAQGAVKGYFQSLAPEADSGEAVPPAGQQEKTP